MIGAILDSLLTRWSARDLADRPGLPGPVRRVSTPVGQVAVLDTGFRAGAGKGCVVLVPDGPNVIEHHERLIALLAPQVRVICFEMPGFGHSLPSRTYRHSLDDGASAIVGVLDALDVRRATLALSCANGFYALRAALGAPGRFASLVLAQTPSLEAMHAWTGRTIPRPIRVPVVGQVVAWLYRGKAAHGWYRTALPRSTDPGPWQAIAKRALANGACFCLAGVVQGLAREDDRSLAGLTLPVTVVWGEQDRSHRATDPGSVLANLPQAEIIRFSDCGHFPDLEAPERFARIVLERVARHG